MLGGSEGWGWGGDTGQDILTTALPCTCRDLNAVFLWQRGVNGEALSGDDRPWSQVAHRG